MKPENKGCELSIKSFDESNGRVIAYASTFDREPDSYGDVVARGAFIKTIAKWARKNEDNIHCPVLFSHITGDPMMNIGKVLSMEEDEKGLLVEIELDLDNPNGAYVYKLLKEGRIHQLSFAYNTLERQTILLEDGRKANELRELDVFEVSIVPIPANQNAVVVDVKDGEQAIETPEDEPEEVVEEEAEESVETDSQPEDDEKPEETTEEEGDGAGDATEEPEETEEVEDEGKEPIATATVKIDAEFTEEAKAAFEAMRELGESINAAAAHLKEQLAEIKNAIAEIKADESVAAFADTEVEPVDEVEEGDSEPVQTVEEKGAPDGELLRKMSEIFEEV